MGWTPTVYFYAGRAHPSYGDVKMAFSTANMPQPVRVAPFDTGGMVDYPGNKYRIDFSTLSTNSFVHQAVAECGTGTWRENLATWLAAYFPSDPEQYFRGGRPEQQDPEGVYSSAVTPDNSSGTFFHTRWTWEIHYDKPIKIVGNCVAWCSTNDFFSQRLDKLTQPGLSNMQIKELKEFGTRCLGAHAGIAECVSQLNEWIIKHACT